MKNRKTKEKNLRNSKFELPPEKTTNASAIHLSAGRVGTLIGASRARPTHDIGEYGYWSSVGAFLAALLASICGGRFRDEEIYGY